MAPRKKPTNTEPSGAPIATPEGSEVTGDPDDALDEALGDLNVLETLGTDVTWYLYRIAKKTSGASTGGSYVMRGSGPFDLEQVRAEVGGGEFLVLAKRGREMVDRRQFTIEGEPRVRAVAPAESPAPATSAAPELVQLLARMSDRLERLEQPAPAAAAPPLTLDNMFAIMDRLHPPASGAAASNNPLGDAQAVIEIAEKLSENQSDSMASVVREALPKAFELIQDVLRVGRRGPVALASGTAGPAEEFNVMVEALARAITFGKSPSVAADSIEELMSADEIAKLHLATEERFLEYVAPYADRYPVLKESTAIEWLKAWLREMQSTNGTVS